MTPQRNSPDDPTTLRLPVGHAEQPPRMSDLAVSPFAMPTALLRGEVRVAFAGRTSTEDRQDPRQSLLRQLERSKAAIPAAWAVVCHFYDVESGRLELDQRGHGTDTEHRFGIPIPRDGGIDDLLTEAQRADRRFDVVICETPSRVARRMYEGLSVERALEGVGVPLLASNEPIKLDGGRAQQILHRRINQSIAEYEVFNILETSWGGLCTHVREGWNIGQPPYGYTARTYRHPNPARAAKGATKSRLEPDPDRGPVVTQIALWRYYERIGYGEIADRLDADLERHPPPTPPGGPARARGHWGKSTVGDILRNPKYTGFQVFNRRATKSKKGAHNAPSLWVWSPEPTHEPLVPKWMFDAINERRQEGRGSRRQSAPHSSVGKNPPFLFRGRLRCGCNRRMEGKRRPSRTYVFYECWPTRNNRGRPEVHAGHQKTTYVREDVLLHAVSAFLADRLFGPQRGKLLAADLAARDDRAWRAYEKERERLQQAVDDFARRQRNIRRRAQECEPDDPFATGLREDYRALERQRRDAEQRLNTLTAAEPERPERPSAEDAGLLDALPYLRLNLAGAPAQLLRRLFDATNLEVRLSKEGDGAEICITLPASHLKDIAETAEKVEKRGPDTQKHALAEESVPRSCGCPQRDSNPCYRLERAASWATRR
ncbi:hypothetical protein GCM10009801_21300 [Streptomyces albiaxialis]|uniref:Resolvase/invertase-type recombinase catalytic domain-containing protein n=1 Tax=Streptomyces albiaxialis TaxID=329523 RepID=A0ABN2VS38_9ACTN